MQRFRFVGLLFGLILSVGSLPLPAQGPSPRLGKDITETARVMLAGSRPVTLRNAQDLGPVSSGMAVPGITLVFRRSAEQEAALRSLLVAQQDPASPVYHHWLTPEAFATQFGLADSDIAIAENWLRSHGFHIDNVARSRDRITFSGTALQVQGAFGAELHHYQVGGQMHFAPASDLSLPAEIAPAIAAVLHISDFRPRPSVKAMSGYRAQFTSGTTEAHYLVPSDIRTMYDVSSNYYGDGQWLAVVGQSYVDTSFASKIGVFEANVGLYPGQYTTVTDVLVPGSGVEAISPGDESESELDIEYASEIAQNANIFLIYVGANQNYSVMDALSFAITQKIAPVISISYGICETLISPSDMDQYDALFEEASAQGQTLVAASGDSGSTACSQDTSSQRLTAAEQQALTVNFPASSPNVTAVGGTQMAAGTFTAGTSTYWDSATGTDTLHSLRSYVPEVVWNEGSAAQGIAAGGGGTSAHFARPTWQSTYTEIPAGNYRLLPDIALQSSIASPGYLLCTSDPAILSAEGQTDSCVYGLKGDNGKYTLAGGTSFAAPIFAGFVALLNQAENASGQGNINPELYKLAAGSGSMFHDITTGTNACGAGTANCGGAGESAYAATAGYDEATGLGSIDVNALMTAWPSNSNGAASFLHTVVWSDGTDSATPGQSEPIRLIVGLTGNAPDNSVPTGGVSVSVDGAIVNSSLAFSETFPGYGRSSTTFNFVPPTVPGSHIITVTYPGDAIYSPASAVFPIMVGNVVASGGLTLSAGNLTVTNGSTGTTKVTVTPSGGYDGRIMWSLSATAAPGNSANLTACYAIAPVLVNGISSTNLTIGIGTACQSAQAASGAAYRRFGQLATSNKQPAHWKTTATTGVYASFLLCGWIIGWRRKSRLMLLSVVLLTVPFAGANLVGCGGGGANSNSSGATSKATTYTLTLSGTDSVNAGITASTTFTLTVD